LRRILADENIPLPTIRRLRAMGHAVLSIAEHFPGIADEEVLARAIAEGAVLLTLDSDFGELVFRRGAPAPPGVLHCRFLPTHPEEIADRLAALPSAAWSGYTSVMQERVRNRPFPVQSE
jgi:predicted nuclease of predicted toxin-antitoxin system